MIRNLLATLHPLYRFRSAVTGQYVTRAYAALHPRECVRERVR